jgi:hypothetical protein
MRNRLMSSARLQWRRSSACTETTCVEVAIDLPVVLVRDSKDPNGPVLRFTTDEWSAFLAGVTAGQFTVEECRR